MGATRLRRGENYRVDIADTCWVAPPVCEFLETRRMLAGTVETLGLVHQELHRPPVALADLNGDGLDDLISARTGSGAKESVSLGLGVAGLRVSLNEKGAAFVDGEELAIKDDAYTLDVWVAAGDVDGDGHADVAVLRSAALNPITAGDPWTIESRLHILHGDGKGGFDGQETFKPAIRGGSASVGAPKKSFAQRGVAIGDLDGDGRGEVIVWAEDECILLHLASRQTHKYEVLFNPKEYSLIVGTGDLDGDGRDDLVAVVDEGLAYASFDFTTGGPPAAKVNKIDSFTIKQGVNVAVGDLDGDGFRDDVAVLGAGHGSVFRSVGGLEMETEVVEYPPGVIADDILIGDVDGDGADDLFTVLKTKHDTAKNIIANIRA
jgi:hypothetical protein